MLQTENLKLNIIEGSDPVSPEPINENFQALEEAIIQARESVDDTNAAILVVKLAEQTLTAQAESVTLDLSAIDLTAYQSLKLYIEGVAATQPSGIFAYVNGDTAENYVFLGSSALTTAVNLGTVSMSGCTTCACEVVEVGDHLGFWADITYGTDQSGVYSVAASEYKNVYLGGSFSALKMLVLDSGGYQFLSGLTIRLYGLKK